MRILFLTWRDTRNPEGGGSEVYVENVASALAAAGHDVTIFCASYPDAAPLELIDGVRFVRRGTKLGVHLEAVRYLRSPTFGTPDVIVDVQNGIPFFARPVRRDIPTVVLVHHVHREQWPVVYGPLRSRIGWALESRISPRLYRECLYVAVSRRTKAELEGIGVAADRVEVIYNGTSPAPEVEDTKAEQPTVLVLGRLVPHKQVEHVLRAAGRLRVRIPDLRIRIIGDGWWSESLRQAATDLGVADTVEFLGFVDERTKHQELARSWVLALPSLKEGWGIVVMEAAQQGVPTIAYRNAGGVTESIVDTETGLLARDEPEFSTHLEALLADETLRKQMGENAREHATHYTWQETSAAFADTLARAANRGRLSVSPAQPVHLGHQLERELQ